MSAGPCCIRCLLLASWPLAAPRAVCLARAISSICSFCDWLLMTTRPLIPLVLVLLLILLQYSIWTGRGSVGQVAELQKNLSELRAKNQQTEADILRLRSEIQDLQEGVSIVEEKARYEMGLVKPNEIFVQITH